MTLIIFLILILKFNFREQLENMNEEQLTRFEFFVRSHFSRFVMKELVARNAGGRYNITDEMAIIVGGLAKLFIGELIETGFKISENKALTTSLYRA